MLKEQGTKKVECVGFFFLEHTVFSLPPPPPYLSGYPVRVRPEPPDVGPVAPVVGARGPRVGGGGGGGGVDDAGGGGEGGRRRRRRRRHHERDGHHHHSKVLLLLRLLLLLLLLLLLQRIIRSRPPSSPSWSMLSSSPVRERCILLVRPDLVGSFLRLLVGFFATFRGEVCDFCAGFFCDFFDVSFQQFFFSAECSTYI